jgi:hypothetical protein
MVIAGQLVAEVGGCSSDISGDIGGTANVTYVENSNGRFYYTKVSASETGYANNIECYLRSGANAEDLFRYAIYDSNGDLLQQTGTGGPTVGNPEMLEIEFSSPECITNAADYYLAVQNTTGEYFYYYHDNGSSSGNNVWYVVNDFASGFPATITPGSDSISVADSQMNIRLTP